MISDPMLVGPSYCLGEIEAHWGHPAWRARAESFAMQLDPELWGWGSVRITRKCIADLATNSIQQTLEAADCDPGGVEVVIFCAMSFPGTAQQQRVFLESILEPCGLGHATPIGLTLGRCTTLLQGIAVGRALVASGTYHRVLVVTADRVEEESERFESFALFSDGAASCLVVHADARMNGLAIQACAEIHEANALKGDISPELAKRVNAQLLHGQDIELDSIQRLLHTNVYLPICIMKERQAGFTRRQLYTDNIARVGHCFAADPIINLVDLACSEHLVAKGHYMLAASVPGARVAILLRKEG